ncbi:MAG TPA: alkaline phosphatase D family protein [Rubrobacteraceae bacterium]|nr:alkaline phosphatase D family protein [Rubrobacteraceae bacterium]
MDKFHRLVRQQRGRPVRRTRGRPMGRRAFLGLGGVGAAGLLLGGGLAYSRNRLLTSPTFSDYPFTLGVASGEPVHDGYSARVVLWTRLAPDPLNGGGMPPNDVEVRWEIASDENFRDVVQSGTEIAPAQGAHSVHAALSGLEPARYYWYRFKAGSEISPVGRTKTPPETGASLSSMSFAFVSCSDFQEGYFPVYRAVAEEDLDVVFHLGDFIYEYGPDPESTRVAQTPAPTDLETYRSTYAEYLLDPDLQAARAMHPWEVIPDDHEVYNNFEGAPEDEDQATAAAFAYWEHMPLRPSASPQAAEGANLLLYRDVTYGDLAQFNMLDTRQYRGEPPDPESDNGGDVDTADPEIASDMVGKEQETWLLDRLASSGARWNVIGNQIGMFDYQAGDDGNMMGWDDHGYARDRIMRYLDDYRPFNPVVITGDLHCSWVSDLKAYYPDENSATVGTEFIGTSITSSLGESYAEKYKGHLGQNPHVRFFDERTGGYVRVDLTSEEWRTEMKVADSIKDRESPVRTFASFVIENGQPGAKQV